MPKVPGLIKGLGVTAGILGKTLKNGADTVQYPHEKEAPPIRARPDRRCGELAATGHYQWAAGFR